MIPGSLGFYKLSFFEPLGKLGPMGTRINKTFFLAPLFYVAVIFGLLFLQFMKRGERFFDSHRELSLTGMTAVGKTEPEIAELHLRYKGINFAFGPRYTVLVTNHAGDEVKLNLLDFKKIDRGFALRFDRDVAVDFLLDEKKEILLIRAVAAGRTPLKIRSLVFRFSVVEGAKANSVERMPILSVNFKEKDYFLSLPGKSTIDMARQQLVVVPDGDGGASLVFGPSSAGSKETFRQWYANQGGAATADLYAKKVGDYISGAYQGWKSGRYSQEDGTWLTERGGGAFRENLLTAYLAESLRKGEYISALEEMQKIASLHANSLTFLSSPFLGNLQNLSERLLLDDERETVRLHGLVRSRDAGVWNRGDLVRFAVDRGNGGFTGDLLKFASDVDLQLVSVSTALGMLRNYYEGNDLDPKISGGLERFGSLINSKIFPSIIKIKEGFFLEVEPGKIDVSSSILAGRVLVGAGSREKDSVLESIGRDLVLSALSLSDKQGFLPRNILVEEMALKGTEGRITPEEVYPFLSENPYYPRFISLSKDLGPGSWLYGAANITDILLSPSENRFQFRFPEGGTHHFIFRGAKPYAELQIWGIAWRIDPRFERYSTGCFFMEKEGIFAVKYRHKKVQEEFLIRYK
jgi:hypothetical protein